MMQKSHRSIAPAVHLVLAAAGSGQRYGAEIPKQYQKIHGKSVLRHVIEKFQDFAELTSLRVIIDPNHAKWYQEAVSGFDLPEPIFGGKTRKSSIYNYISNISDVKNEDIVLIHDAVRPLICAEDVVSLIKAMNHHDAASLASRVTSTLRHGASENMAGGLVSRENLWAMETPQAFQFGLLKKAHIEADPALDYTDDTSLVSALGIDVKLVETTAPNIKITTPKDMDLVAAMMMPAFQIRTGMGFDVHAFDDAPDRALILCGVKIEGHKGLKGHSDADVGLHALTDALLGALALGDIGHHFPPSDQTYKNMASHIFLEKACDMIREKGASLENADITLICETPKIGTYREKMQRRIAEILEVSPGRISIKATTTEKLGFTGRGEGIAAQALVTLKLPAKP